MFAGNGSAADGLGFAWWARALTPSELSERGTAEQPSWVAIVEQAVAAAAPHGVPPSAADGQDPLAMPLRPFLTGVRERLAEGARCRLLPAHADPGRLADAYTAVLGRQLVRIAHRTMAFELDKALAGEDRREGLAALVTWLCTPAGLAGLFRQYPVLARLLGVTSQLAVVAGLELLSRFAADRAAVVGELLGGVDPGPVVAIEPGLGDRHQQGRSVTGVSFADGRTVIYKPRPLTVHIVFRQVTDWLNQLVPAADLRTPVVVLRPDYGWLEFVASRPLPGPGSAAEFYRRVGTLLAALYAMHASDMHSENLIADGAAPILVDVETLFHPDLPIPRTTAADPAAEALSASVYRAALLPYVSVGEDGTLDRSGMGGRSRNRTAGNRLSVGGELIEPAEHETAVLEGFRLGYDAIAAERAAFSRLIRSCDEVEVRTIARPTCGYARLIDESAHPDLLRDARDRDQALGVLREVSAHHPLWDSLTRYELADLWNGDIPLLTTRPPARDIWTSAGHRLPGVLDRSGLGSVLDKVARMGEVDRRDQEWVISASLATRRPHDGHRGTGLMPGAVTGIAAEPGRLLAAACGLADQIVARASCGRERTDRSRVNWLSLQLVEDTQWMLLPMGASLADGYLGVALFLAQLAGLTGIDRYADVARRAVSALPELLDALDGRPELVSAIGCGGSGGLGGISYGLARVAGLLHEAELEHWAGTAAELAATVDLSASPWWAAGSAGCLAAMISVAAETGSLPASDLARSCADRLSELVERTAGRCVPDGEPVPTGFAAGPAGVGWALTRFAATSAEPRYLAAGRLAARCAVELSATPAGAGSSGWCSGSAGLLLARTCVLAEVGELNSAARALSERPVLSDLSLCHGEIGIAETLTVLAAATRSRAAYQARRHRAGLILAAINQRGSYCGTPGGVSTPGMLHGLAGIGYGLLRLGFAEQVPSVLLLEPGPLTQQGEIDERKR
jgi:lantibiotic modifying enzyme